MSGTTRRKFMAASLFSIAGGTVHAQGVEPKESTSVGDKKKNTYDLVICGLGMGGIVTAIRATENGLKPILIEKMGSPAGNTVYSVGDMLGVNTKMQQEGGIKTDDTPEKFYEDMVKVSGGRGDPGLIRIIAENADETLNWLRDYCGVKYSVGLKYGWPLFMREHNIAGTEKPGGKQLMTYMMKKAQELNIPILYNTKVVALIDDDKTGKIIGVKVKTRKGYEEYFGKLGVVLATGGFSANQQLITMMAGAPAANMPLRGSRAVTGENILLTAPFFPMYVNVNQFHCGPIHGPTGANPFNAVNNGMIVSKDTERYTNEGLTYVQIARNTAANTKENWGYVIMDAETHALPKLKNDWSSYELKKAPVYKADTIEELARETGLDPEKLNALVKSYNEHYDAKTLDKMNPPNTNSMPRPIRKPPFYAIPFQGGMTTTFGGPKINAKGQIIDTEGKPIPGLYAVGNAAGGIFHGNYIGGTQLTAAAVFGRRIADHMKSMAE